MTRKAVVVLLLLLAGVWRVAAAENKGAAMITLDGGKQGAVQFPHQRHQAKLENNCKVCHDLFPQQPGAIAQLKKEGQLKPKQVMNQRCIKCHKAEKQAGHAAGPVICSKCHHKG
jgi:uncharacterized membrane protein